MTKVYGDDLTKATELYSEEIFNSNNETNKDVQSQIQSFISYSDKNLNGEIWNEVRTKMAEFQTAFNDLTTLTQDFGDTIQKAIKMLTEAADGDTKYDFLDTENLDSLKKELTTLQQQLEEAKLGSTVQTKELNEDGTFKTITTYDETLISSLESSIKEKEKLISRTEHFIEVYNEASKMLEEAYQKVQTQSNSVNSINVSKKVIYSKTN